MKRLYVGNLPYDSCNEEGVRELFDGFVVEEVHVILDRENNNQPKGFVFVEMTTDAEAQRAIKEVDGATFGNRTVKVNIANDRPKKNNRDERRRPREY